MSHPFSLQGRTALITGGTRGIGRAISLAFARAGCAVIANYVRDQAAADDLLALAGRELLAIQVCRADLSNDVGIKALIAFLDAAQIRPSAVIHCAATGVHRPVDQLTLRHFDWTYALNVRAFFALVTQLIPRLDPGSSIVALSSEGANVPSTITPWSDPPRPPSNRWSVTSPPNSRPAAFASTHSLQDPS